MSLSSTFIPLLVNVPDVMSRYPAPAADNVVDEVARIEVSKYK
jgi:hypothetical protein